MESETGPDAGEPVRSTEPGTDSTPFAPVDPTPPAASTPPPSPTAPALPPYPAQGQPYQGQAGQPYPGQPYAGQPYPGQPFPGQPYPGYGPTPANPYGQPPYGYGAMPRPSGINGLAIASLVLGICGFFFVTPIIGLTLGLVGLSTVRRTGQKGKSMAISGIVLSSLWIALFATIITVAIIAMPDPARRDADGNVVAPGAVAIFRLHPRDCFTVPAGLMGSANSHIRNVTVVPCSTGHDAEAFGSFTATDGSFPGVDALRSESLPQCFKLLSPYLPDVESLPAGSHVEFIYPNKQAWGLGERHVECFIHFPAATMTQSVQRDLSSYTADQQRYLTTNRPMLDAISELSATPQSAPLAEMQQRASDVADATRSEISALTATPWPAEVEPVVDMVVVDDRNAARLWSQASTDDGVSSFIADVRQAEAAYDVTDVNAVRTAVGLPAVSADSGGEGDQAA